MAEAVDQKTNDRAIMAAVGKGELTRQTILDRALHLAAREGLDALTIGRLADDTGMSKSGLFAHFGAKDVLQAAVLQHAAELFVELVIRPALKAPRGEARLRAIFERWMHWAHEAAGRAGCIFVGASTELDDKPGLARDELVKQQRDWLRFIAGAVRLAVDEGQFRRSLDASQFAYDMYGIMLAYYHASRLLKDPSADVRARRAFDALVAAGRSSSPSRTRKRPSLAI